MKRLLPLIVAVFALLLAAAPARADQIIKWGYSWDVTPSVYASPTGKDPGGVILFSGQSQQVAYGATDLVAANLTARSTASAETPDVFKKSQGKYTLTLTIYDYASHTSGTLSFTGQLSGWFSATNSDVDNKFGNHADKILRLGTSKYTVKVDRFLPPGPPNENNSGAIGARVTVVDPPVDTPPAPEPSTLLLGGLGAALAGVAAWRRRTRPLAA
jgi:hypothetical protein